MMPHISVENSIKLQNWREFHRDLLSGGDAARFTYDVLERVNEALGKGLPDLTKIRFSNHYMLPSDVSDSFMYFYTRGQECNPSDSLEVRISKEKEVCKSVLTYVKSILDGKVKYVDGEVTGANNLSERDRKLGEEFIKYLSRPYPHYLAPERRHPFRQ
jgi:hypothetical protein